MTIYQFMYHFSRDRVQMSIKLHSEPRKSNVNVSASSGRVISSVCRYDVPEGNSLAVVLINFFSLEVIFCFFLASFSASVDVGFAVYDRYAATAPDMQREPVSYAAHLMGAFAGLTIGLAVLKNFEQKLHEQLIWWVALSLYVILACGAIFYNLVHPYDSYQGHW